MHPKAGSAVRPGFFTRKSPAVWLGALALALAGLAGMAPGYGRETDHDQAREALQSGQVLPLQTVLAMVGREHPGQVVKVEFEQEAGVYLYEIKVLRASGDIVKLKVDARDGRVLAVKERNHRSRSGD